MRRDTARTTIARLALLAALVAFAAAPARAGSAGDRSPLLTRADAIWLLRAQDRAASGRANHARAQSVVEAYAAAVLGEPRSLEARWKLVRALYFASAFAAVDAREASRQLERATREADVALDLVAARSGVHGSLGALNPEALRDRLRVEERDDAAGAFFWSAVVWGAFGQQRGGLVAVREGVAARLYQCALAVQVLAPGFEDAGVYRLLARIDAEVPRIPFVSSFVDRTRAVSEAERAVSMAPAPPWNRYFLALTLLDLAPTRRAEALQLLQDVAASEPRTDQEIEDLAARRAAQQRLSEERGTGRELAQQDASGG